IFNCTIVANEATAPEEDNAGGIQSHTLAASRIANCILTHNTPTQLSAAHTGVRHSAIAGGFTGPDAVAILAGDPRLVRLPAAGKDATWGTPDDEPGDLRLAPGSICID